MIKMKILWKINIVLPIIASHIGLEKSSVGGWLDGLSNELLKVDDIELAICFPNIYGDYITGNTQNLKYYGFPYKNKKETKYYLDTEIYMKKILDDFKPDLVHIFGSEYSHSLALAKVYNNPSKTIINIQGLTSVIANLYSIGLPSYVKRLYTLRDLVRGNIIKEEKTFRRRGIYEIEALKSVDHVIGRTDWDEACSLSINPKRIYHFCNETLRDSFYHHAWDINKIERHSMFLSQAHYPLKGLHFLIPVLSNLIKKYPDAKLYVSGYNPLQSNSFKDKLKQSYYSRYLRHLIKKHKLDQHIVFLGNLDESQMVQRFIKTHVFVSPSTIENESNSLSEAKILGCPSVASFVGGVTNRIDHGNDGYLYPLNEPYMMEFYIDKIFQSDDLANKISFNAKKNAKFILDKTTNLNQMLGIYKDIMNS